MSKTTNTTVKPETSVKEAAAPSGDANANALAAAAAAQAAKEAELKAKVKAERDALVSAWETFKSAADNIGALGLELLARDVGQSVNTAGRPGFAAWMRFNSVLALRGADFKTHDRFYAMAKRAAFDKLTTEDKKSEEDADKACAKFVSSKGKGSTGKATCTVKMAQPAAWDIALGE